MKLVVLLPEGGQGRRGPHARREHRSASAPAGNTQFAFHRRDVVDPPRSTVPPLARFGHQRTPQYTRQLDLIEVAAGLRPVVELLLELERTVTDGVKDRRDHLQMRSRILHLP